jgi:hypothetical protein
MAEDLRKSTSAVNAEADALGALLNNGYLRLYSGSRPATANDAVTSQTLLAELRFASTAFGAASGGTITAGAITQDTAADATGAATWYRALQSDGTTAVMDGTVGTSDANLVMNNNNIQVNAIASVSSFTYTVPASV